jgi:hypothetical protein
MCDVSLAMRQQSASHILYTSQRQWAPASYMYPVNLALKPVPLFAFPAAPAGTCAGQVIATAASVYL